ncbi:MAG: hypothetical protein OER82_10855 [Nitrosopumilus sp.]|nr:hypothetical protein [Nitrosopumilus sp.]
MGIKIDAKLIDMKKLHRETKKVVTTKFERDEMSQEKFTQKTENIRDNYQSLEQIMLKEKDQMLKIMEFNHGQYVREFIKNFESISDVKIVWSSDDTRYRAARM